MLSWLFQFGTYQNVKNNLSVYFGLLMLVATAILYGLFLDQPQRNAIWTLITTLGTNGLLATVMGALIFIVYAAVAYILIQGVQIHDHIYDKYIVRWREKYDLEFILPRLTESFKAKLPGNFADYAHRYRDKFMVPYYEFVGDRKTGIEENTRIRFYERITWYWFTQLNELFILVFLLATPVFILFTPGGSFNLNNFTIFVLVLVLLGLLNRWLVRVCSEATAQATLAEIEEILAKSENKQVLRARYITLCKDNRL